MDSPVRRLGDEDRYNTAGLSRKLFGKSAGGQGSGPGATRERSKRRSSRRRHIEVSSAWSCPGEGRSDRDPRRASHETAAINIKNRPTGSAQAVHAAVGGQQRAAHLPAAPNIIKGSVRKGRFGSSIVGGYPARDGHEISSVPARATSS